MQNVTPRIFASESRPSIASIFNGLASIIIIRTMLEAVLEKDHTLSAFTSPEFYETLVDYGHVYISWMCLFINIALLVAIFVRIRLIESIQLVLWSAPVCLIVPLVDYFVEGGSRIDYGTDLSSFLPNYLNLFNPAASIQIVSVGVRIEVALATIGAFLGALLYFRRPLVASVGLATSLYTTIFIFGYLPALMPEFRGILPSQKLLLMYLPMFIQVMVCIAICLTFEQQASLRVIYQLLYPSRLLFYLFLLSFGMVFIATRTERYPSIFSTGGGIRLCCASLSVTLLFLWSKLKNDYYDQDIDQISNADRKVFASLIGQEDFKSLGTVFVLPSFVFGLGVGRYAAFFWLFIFALSAVYSEPPFRLRRFYPVGHYILSLIAAACFLLGTSIVCEGEFFTIRDVPRMTGCAFASAFFLAHLKDYKDVDGDAKAGVMNIYSLTKYPRALGIIVIGCFLATLLLVISFVPIKSLAAYVLIGIFSLVAVVAIVKSPDIRQLDWILRIALTLVVSLALIWIAI